MNEQEIKSKIKQYADFAVRMGVMYDYCRAKMNNPKEPILTFDDMPTIAGVEIITDNQGLVFYWQTEGGEKTGSAYPKEKFIDANDKWPMRKGLRYGQAARVFFAMWMKYRFGELPDLLNKLKEHCGYDAAKGFANAAYDEAKENNALDEWLEGWDGQIVKQIKTDLL